jgi:hypothetical protein
MAATVNAALRRLTTQKEAAPMNGIKSMPKVCYQGVNFSTASLTVIQQANRILSEYAERGIIVTLRQIYYQFVARDLIRNRLTEYKRLGSIINDARLAGLIDWNNLQDRTRNLNSLSHWGGPSGVIESAATAYHRDLWAGQANYVEVWIEKDALVGVIENICEEWDVPYFSCRGYTSQSEMWGASQRLLTKLRGGRTVHVLHLGDHDPSGIDMTRDIRDRLTLFCQYHLKFDWMKKNGHPEDERGWQRLRDAIDPQLPQVHRIALNMDQVEKYNPPPNPAKITDSRAAGYIREFGDESWELDALDPDVLVDLIRTNILSLVDVDRWNAERDRQEREREVLIKTSANWPAVAKFVRQFKRR